MKLSRHFALHEFLRSQTAERHGIDMTPPTHVIVNLQTLVNTCLQPLRDDIKSPIFISSGYRPKALNTKIGGSENSAHMRGCAADFVVAGMTPLQVCERIESLDLPFDQCIHEFGRWVHLGIVGTGRQELLTAYKVGKRTRYRLGLHRIEELTTEETT